MKRSAQSPLLILSDPDQASGVYQDVRREEADWEFLNFQARRLKKGENWTHDTGENEYAIVLLGGNFTVESNRGAWKTENGRKDVCIENNWHQMNNQFISYSRSYNIQCVMYF